MEMLTMLWQCWRYINKNKKDFWNLPANLKLLGSWGSVYKLKWLRLFLEYYTSYSSLYDFRNTHLPNECLSCQVFDKNTPLLSIIERFVWTRRTCTTDARILKQNHRLLLGLYIYTCIYIYTHTQTYIDIDIDRWKEVFRIGVFETYSIFTQKKGTIIDHMSALMP